MFNDSLRKGILPPSLRQEVIILIPKPNKDNLSLDGWRPITLFNSDTKLFSLSKYSGGAGACLPRKNKFFLCQNSTRALNSGDFSSSINEFT